MPLWCTRVALRSITCLKSEESEWIQIKWKQSIVQLISKKIHKYSQSATVVIYRYVKRWKFQRSNLLLNISSFHKRHYLKKKLDRTVCLLCMYVNLYKQKKHTLFRFSFKEQIRNSRKPACDKKSENKHGQRSGKWSEGAGVLPGNSENFPVAFACLKISQTLYQISF